MLILLACSSPAPPAPTAPAAQSAMASPPAPGAPPVEAAPVAALSPEPDALSGEIGEIDPGGAAVVLVRLRPLVAGCELSLLELPSIEPHVLASLPVCPAELLVDADRLIALTPGASVPAWGVRLQAGSLQPLDAAPPSASSLPHLRRDPFTAASALPLDPAEVGAIQAAAASPIAAWTHNVGPPEVVWVRGAAGPDTGPVLVREGWGWAVLPGTATIAALRLDRRGNWLAVGTSGEARLFDLRNSRLVWKDPSLVWFWPEGAGRAPI